MASMPSDAPNATWHPAFMPNSSVNVAPAVPVAPVANKTTELAEPALQAVEEDLVTRQTETVVPQALEPLEVDQHDTSAADDWFPEYESTSPWLEHSQPVPAPFQPTSTETEANDVSLEDDGDEAAFYDKAAKHSSTISFSRTVSHDVDGDDGDDGNDDDEAAWDFQRTDSDPFKFMPPSDRTNSFPAVPLMESADQQEGEAPLASRQAEDVPHDLDGGEGWRSQTRSPEPIDPRRTPIPGSGGPNDDDYPSQYIGGDVVGPTAQAFDERYTEGMPLMSNQDGVDHHNQGAIDSSDPFAQDGGDDDDFFDQVGASGAPVTDEPAQTLLERKSTMQVIDAISPTRTGPGYSAPEGADELVNGDHEEGDVFAANRTLQNDGSGDDRSAEPAEGKELDAQWAAVFGDDGDDFLLEDPAAESNDIDFSAFLGDDDDGLLDDTIPDDTAVDNVLPAAKVATPTTPQPPAVNRYMPSGTGAAPAPARQPSNPYFPSVGAAAVTPAVAPFTAPPLTAPPMTTPFGYGAPPVPRPEANKAASFADKAKGGYQSPYDLPMEVVKPRKRQSMQQLPKTTTAPAPPVGPPVRSSSAQVVSPTRGPPSQIAPPTSGYLAQPAAGTIPPPQTKKADNFFEELPMSAKVRPASRHSQHSLPSPSQTSPYGPPLGTAQGSHQVSPATYQPRSSPQFAPPNMQHPPQQPAASDLNKLVAPPPVNPYAPLQSNPAPQPGSLSSGKYSPAPAQLPQNGTVSAPPSKYSPAPNGRLPSAQYQAVPAPVPPQVLSHQPRTSSPLAHFEISHDRARPGPTSHSESHLSDRRSSASHYEPRLNRVPSLPPTQELPDEDVLAPVVPTIAGPPAHATYATHRSRHTPPPPHAQSALSPPKRVSAYSPQSQPQPPALTHPSEFVPPQRSQTQSPGALYGSRASAGAAEPIPRPSSVHDPTSPRTATIAPLLPVSAHVAAPSTRSRTFSQNFNFVAPTDGREQDPLQRWKGSPTISWGVGGTLVSSFPKNVPRYGMNQTSPMFIRSPGEVVTKSIKELYPLEERLLRFPGPLKGRSKKKEVVAWLSTGIESLERGRQNLALSPSHEDKRSAERILLWKILQLLIEFDGVLEGSPAVEQAVRDVLIPRGDAQAIAAMPLGAVPLLAPGFSAGIAQMKSDAVDSATVEQVRASLLIGDRDKAVWQAADKRLWGHALLIASRTSPELFKQVTQEFVRKEVNYPGHSNEPLAALYEVLSGNHEECVDELVPRHARMGRELMTTTSSALPSKDALAGLDKWQETLALILSNRSVDDIRALNSLGDLLSEYGRAEAAHICFVFARHATVFGGLDDPKSNFVLVGADHRRQASQFAKDTEALLLSEVYEYGLSLGSAPNAGSSSPHLAAYKLQHAMTLAEYGQRDKALQYCEAIASAMTSQTRRSPYYHAILEAAVEDLMKRLRQAPKEESSSWIPKPSMNKVSDTVWNRFNKFVAGDDNDGSGPGSDAEGGAEAGPFARLAGGTPTISRPPSASGATGMEMFGPPAHHPPAYPVANGTVVAPPASRAASRYAPMAGQAAGGANPYDPTSAYTPSGRSSLERTSGEHNRSSYDLPRQSSELSSSYNPSYLPNNAATPSPGYPDSAPSISRESSYVPLAHADAAAPPLSQAPPPGHQPYQPSVPAMNGSPYAPHEPSQLAKEEWPAVPSYQAPSYGYEPPSMNTTYEETPPDSLEAPATGERPGGVEESSYQPYTYEPPTFNPVPDEEGGDEPQPKKKSFMDDDDDDIPALRQPTDAPKALSKEDKDRENAEMFRRAAEEDGMSSAPPFSRIPLLI